MIGKYHQEGTLDAKPGRLQEPTDQDKKLIADEMCDVIKVLYNMANQMGIDGDFDG